MKLVTPTQGRFLVLGFLIGVTLSMQAGAQSPANRESAAIALFDSLDFKRALPAFEALARENSSVRPLVYLGRILTLQHRTDSAITVLEKAVARLDTAAEPRLWLLRALEDKAQTMKGRPDAAVVWAAAGKQANRLAMYKNDRAVQEEILQFHVLAPESAGGNANEALAEATALARFGGYSHDFWTAWVNEKSDNIGAADLAYRRLVKEFPDSAQPRVRLVTVLLKQRQVDAALALIDERLEHSPDDPTTLYALGQLGTNARRAADSERALRRFLLHPMYAPLVSPAGAHYFLGRAIEAQGRDGDAMTEYERALQLDSTLTQAGSAITRLHDSRTKTP